MRNILTAPSILSCDFANLETEIKRIEAAGADWVHIDVMDGHFVPNITIGAPVVKSLKRITKLTLDVHLMIENPEKYIKDFSDAGADIITIHCEATKEKTEETLKLIKSYGIKTGLSIKPKTEPKEIKKYAPDTDIVLIMTVEPGFGGQKFMSDCADKIPEIRKYFGEETIIEIDGGINDITAKYCKDLGADVLVSGNYIFSASNIKAAIDSLR